MALIAHYKLADNADTNVVVDETGNNNGTLGNGLNNFTSENSTEGIVEPEHKALSFDGVDDYVEVADALIPASTFHNGFTISAWINATTLGENNSAVIVGKVNGTSSQQGINFRVGAHAIFLRINAGTTINSAAASLKYGVWLHVVVTVTSNAIANFYIDGVLSGTPNQQVSALSGITTTNALRIGNRSAATDRTFDGSIDDVRIYDHALTADEVANLYNKRATIGMKELKTNYPITDGLIARTTKQTGRKMQLEAEQGSFIPQRERVGIDY
jgi:hypothetical protein